MFKSILVPIDLADTDLAKPAIATAATLSQTWSGAVRLLNVLPMTPVMLAEYVPADFDSQQRQTSEEALAIVARESGIEPSRISCVVRQGGIYHEILEEAAADQGRPDRDDVAPAGDAHLFPRLQRRPCRALRQMLGAGGAALKTFRQQRIRIELNGACQLRVQGPSTAASIWQRTMPISRRARSSSAAQRFDGDAAVPVGRRARKPIPRSGGPIRLTKLISRPALRRETSWSSSSPIGSRTAKQMPLTQRCGALAP